MRERRYPQSALTVVARPRAPARRLLDRVPHPPGSVHAGAPARRARRAPSLQPGVGDERSGSEAARRARRRRARRGDRAPGALAARRDADRGRARALPAGAPKRRPPGRDPAGAGRRRGARLSADRRAGAQPGPARRQGADRRRDRQRRPRRRRGARRLRALARRRRRCSARPPSPDSIARCSPTCAPVDLARGLGLAALGAIGPLRRLAMREGVAPLFAG